MRSTPSAPVPCDTVRVDRAALHAFIETQSDLIERTPVPDDVLTPEDIFPAVLDPERLWRVAGLATLIGLAIYEDAERFISPQGRGVRQDAAECNNAEQSSTSSSRRSRS